MLPFIFLVVGVLAQQTFADEPEAIVGGQDAAPGEFPHQCSLRYGGSHICGCSIVNQYTILTAAHCVDGMSVSNFKIATNTINIRSGTLYNVARIIKHPRYTGQQRDAWNNDVAIIKLTTPVQYNQHVKAIPLASSPPAAGQRCTLSGWGMLRANGPLPDTLQKMDQYVVSQDQCKRAHPGMPLDSSHLCTLNRAGIGACQGDSGGPLISNGVQVGVTSWVSPCARGMPDAYANVANLRNFIDQNS